jgi:hypothetical protein
MLRDGARARWRAHGTRPMLCDLLRVMFDRRMITQAELLTAIREMTCAPIG